MPGKDETVTIRFDQRSTRRIDRLTRAVERLVNIKEAELSMNQMYDKGHLYQKIGPNWLHRIDICPECTAESQSDNTKEESDGTVHGSRDESV